MNAMQADLSQQVLLPLKSEPRARIRKTGEYKSISTGDRGKFPEKDLWRVTENWQNSWPFSTVWR